MKNKKAVYALIIRIVGFLVGLTAITLQFVTNKINGKGFMSNHVLAYFTLQTNIFTTLVFLVLIIKTIIESKKQKQLVIGKINETLHIATVYYICITMSVYWFVLAPMLGIATDTLTFFDTLFLHTLTPICALVDCILFVKHGTLNKLSPVKFLIYPILYILLIVVIANTSSIPYYKFSFKGELIPLMYPYPFIDPQVVGTLGMILIFILLIVMVLGIGYLVVLIDNALVKRKK